jgi:TetR/AcrR family transcriptional regulator, cholesterol catabolism regulator
MFRATIPPAEHTERKRRPGRPSQATAQRARIAEAFAEEARRSGVAGASVDRVAGSLGISRALVFHYFGDLRALTRAVVESLVKNSVRDLTEGRERMALAQRRRALVKFVAAGPHFQQLADIPVLAEIIALARRDEVIAAMIKEMWDIQIGAVIDEVRACFPKASLADCKAVGYALTCLGEQHWWLTFLGPGAKQSASAQRAAEVLIATLEIPNGKGKKKRSHDGR